MAVPNDGRLVVVANQSSPRWRHLEREALPHGLRLERLSWRDVLRVEGDLRGCSTLHRPATLRIESPDRDEDIARGLMRLALKAPASMNRFDETSASRDYEKGEIRAPRQFHAGFSTLLARMEESLRELPWVHPWTAPSSILAMFDKVETRQRLAQAQLPRTTGFEPDSVETMLSELRSRGWRSAYLKLRYGWSGCGIVMLDLRSSQGVSTVDEVSGRWVNTRRLRWRPLDELHDIMAFIVAEGATCERAVPLMQLDGDPFDVRLVVVDDRVAFSVFRQSIYPITNLHLVGRRAPPERCRRIIGERLWCDALDAAIRATRLHQAPVAGVDIAFDRSGMTFSILELNAFGDFFPDLRDELGRSVHQAVLQAIAGARLGKDQPGSKELSATSQGALGMASPNTVPTPVRRPKGW